MMKFLKKSFKRELLFSFIIISVIPLFASCFMTFQVFKEKIHGDIIKNDEEKIDVIESLLRDEEELILKSISNLSRDSYIRDLIVSGDFDDISANNRLFIHTKKIRGNVTADIYRGSMRVLSTKDGNISGMLDENWGIMKKARDNKGEIVSMLSYSDRNCMDPVLEFGKFFEVENKMLEKIPAYVICSIDYKGFRNIFGSLVDTKDRFGIFNSFYEPIYIDGGSSKEQGELKKIRSNEFFKEPIDESKGHVYIRNISDDFNLIYASHHIIAPELEKSMMYLILLFSGISIIICVIVSGLLSRYLYVPVKRISYAMKRLRHGDMSVRIYIDREDEFKNLSDGFNKMAVRIDNLISERIENEKTLNETKIAMMQAQLNPHFLYNTLDTIKWLAKSNDVPEIAELSQKLAKILRQAISGDSFCRLSEEIKLVENYCDIQKIRFDNTFTMNCHIKKELMGALIPKLIIQPIVENSIIHGFFESETGTIDIRARKSNNDLIIEVQDNGYGMDENIINLINTRESRKIKGHLGIHNVDTIIRMYYGDKYGIFTEKPEGKGSLVIIKLPYIEEEVN